MIERWSQRNFRTQSIFPTFEELVLSEQQELESNIIRGPYRSVNHYLQTHFWLLREDFVSPLRKGIQDYIEHTDGRNSEFESSYVKIYKKVKFVKTHLYPNQYGGQKEGVLLFFDPNRNLCRQEGNLERSKMFMLGSLLCFTCNSFRTLLLATVTNRDHKYLSKSQVVVELCEDYEEDIYSCNYMMIESETFFMPYFHVLKALQELSAHNLPFQEYIVNVQERDDHPQYLRNRLRVPVLITVSGFYRDYQFNVLDWRSWPGASELGVNHSQLRALQAALTEELVVIQGPPGTGKTFMALKITKILVENRVSLGRKPRPILVVCMTNHALDQFLMGMRDFTDKLVRIGGQSKCRELEEFNFNEMKGSRRHRFEKLKQKDVIGLTTTGAARLRTELNRLGCEVVIVEEAAEVLEAHVIACLSDNCKHLILIGDHKQLRPKVAEYDMEIEHNLHISLFERMVINRNKCSILEVQHRMAPEISALIVPSIYNYLKNHESVYEKPTLKSLAKRVAFVTHSHRESEHKARPGKTNWFEASYVIELSKHLLKQQGYTHQDITILTTYKGQMFLIKQMISRDTSNQADNLANIRVAVVDDFQGEECNIIILSLVRSNRNRNIGFLATENRVCVALSRAKNGLVMVGNMDTLSSRSHIWKSIKHTLENQNALGSFLLLRCKVHSLSFGVFQPGDFERLAPNGGCNQVCLKPMDCGHVCKAICHQDFQHPKVICCEPCLRYCNAGLHPCLLECRFKCGSNCEIGVLKKLSCGDHEAIVKCKESVSGIVCQDLCARLNRNCKGNHLCSKLCHEDCDLCLIEVVATRPGCQHPIEKLCYEDFSDLPKCEIEVEFGLSCGVHRCTLRCKDIYFRSVICLCNWRDIVFSLEFGLLFILVCIFVILITLRICDAFSKFTSRK